MPSPMPSPIVLKSDAVNWLISRDPRLRHADGTPDHNSISSRAGITRSQWWKIRSQDRLGVSSLDKLLQLAESTGADREDAYEQMFTARAAT